MGFWMVMVGASTVGAVVGDATGDGDGDGYEKWTMPVMEMEMGLGRGGDRR